MAVTVVTVMINVIIPRMNNSDRDDHRKGAK